MLISVHIALECQRGAVADPARAGNLDGLADMESEVLGRYQAEPELARMHGFRNVLGDQADHRDVLRVVRARDG